MATFDSNEIENRMPHNIEAEKSIISCILQDNSLVDEAFAIVTPDMFYDPLNRALFESIIELKTTGSSIDKITLKDKADTKSDTKEIFTLVNNIRTKIEIKGFDKERLSDEFFIDIIRSTPLSSNIGEYCRIVKDKYILRKTIKTCEQAIIDCRKNEIPTKEILGDAQSKLFDYSTESAKDTYRKIDEGIVRVISRMEEAAKTPDGITGVRTGFTSMDARTAGFQKGTMNVLAARPGIGKTAFAINMAYNMSKKFNQNVLYFSLEMTLDELLMRVMSIETGISGTKLKRASLLNQKDWGDIRDGIANIKGTSLFVDDYQYLTIADLRNRSLKLANDLNRQNKKLDIIFIDYLQLMHAGDNYKNASKKLILNREQEVAEISRNIKALSKELEIPIIALAQLNRGSEEKKRPQLSDLRDSGAIEQDADIVMLIHSNRNDPDAEDKNRTEIIFAKHRSGEVGTNFFRFDNTTTQFNELDMHS